MSTERPVLDPTRKRGLFELATGQNLTFTFALVSSLFLLWGFCNGMIDTMDKHFQDELGLSKAQSAWVQFAHYMGYTIMALPAGLITRRIGYKGGIIFGLMFVAMGGFWFWPATGINQFWAFLMGVCLIAMGLTVLETVANPYTTVLGPKEYGATRINLAQSFNGIGWIFGPIIAGLYFYSEGGVEKAQGQLFVPYVGVAIIVLIIAAMFVKAPVPDVKVEDEFHTDDTTPAVPVAKERNRGLILLMMFLNIAAIGLSVFLVCWKLLPEIGVPLATILHFYSLGIAGLVVLGGLLLIPVARKITVHSIWAHPHFSGATLTQFVYVAAQCGIFSFFINAMTVDKDNGYAMVPPLPASWNQSFLKEWGWIDTRTAFLSDEITNFQGLAKQLKAETPVGNALAAFYKAQTSLVAAQAKGAASPTDLAKLQADVDGANKALLAVQADPANAASNPVAAFLNSQLSREKDGTIDMLAAYQPGAAVDEALQKALVKEMNQIVRQELSNRPNKPAKAKPNLFDPTRFAGFVAIKAEATPATAAVSVVAPVPEAAHLVSTGPKTAAFIKELADRAKAKKELLDQGKKDEAEKIKDPNDHDRLRLNRLLLADAMPDILPYHDSILAIADFGASRLSSIAFGFFLAGRLFGAWLLKRLPANKTLGIFALMNVGVCGLIIAKLGLISVIGVFLSYFFMSIMFPTIFAVGIHGLGSQSKKQASAFIVMSITGGALMPLLMGQLGDVYNMSVAFWMPLVCFALIATYAFFWKSLCTAESAPSVSTAGGH